MIYIGIDNGVTTGGMVALSDHFGPPIAMTTIPTQRHRSRNEVDVVAIKEWFHIVCNGWPENATFIMEEPNNSRTPSTAYSVASCFHAIRGLIESKSPVRFHRVTPQSWQKEMLGKIPKGESKPMALAKARKLWPKENWLETPRCKTPHEGLIDAALIAEYGRTKNL